MNFQELQRKQYQLDMEYPNGLDCTRQNFQLEPESNLNIDNLIDADKDKMERANHFICVICTMIVRDAQECSSCQSIFCAPCIQPWIKKNKTCPKRCHSGEKPVEYESLHKYVKQDLLALKFKCENAECNFSGPYEQAMDHLKTCDF